MNEQNFETMLMEQLGGNLVDVELESSDYARAFDRAKRNFIQYGNNNLNLKFAKIDVQPNKTEYVLDASVDTVVRIIREDIGFYTNDPFSRATMNDIFNGLQGGTGSLLNYELGLGLIERIQRMTAYDVDFTYSKRNNTLRILKQPKMSATWLVECYANLEDEEYREVLWVQEWSLAECKEILGHAYSKFQNIRSPSGETSLNGDQLLQEAQDMKQRLREEPQNFTDGDPVALPIMIG